MKKARKHLYKVSSNPLLNYFPTSEELINQAYKQAREVTLGRKFKSPIVKRKSLNALKAKTFGEYMQKKLLELSKQFPDIENMNPFYKDLLESIVDVGKLKMNLSRLNASSMVIKKIRSQYGRKIFSSDSTAKADKYLKEFEGRTISVIKKLNNTLKELKKESMKMKEIPSIDFEKTTIVLSGFPNVGKTTLLKRLTSSKARVAEYQFTTKQINVGHFEHRYIKIQVLDTPGLLDREQLNNIEKKAVAAIKHLASLIVFVIDPTKGCGFSLEKQLSLLKQMKKQFKGVKLIVVVNKSDAASEKEMEEVLKEIKDAVIEGESKEYSGNLLEAVEGELASGI